jgi:hypothetical protein
MSSQLEEHRRGRTPGRSDARRTGARAGLALAATGCLLAAACAVSTAAPTGSTAAPPARRTLVVATNGDDHAPGTVRRPLASIATAVALLPNGGRILLRGGHYAQQVVLGPDVHDLTVQPFRHEHPVLDGSELSPPAGRSGMVTIDGSRAVQVSGLDITAYDTVAKDAVPVGIYVHGAATRVTLRGNHVHTMGNYNGTLGSFEQNAHGIAVYGDSPAHSIRGLWIVGNEVDHLSLGASESVVVNGNVDGWRISRNYIHDNNNIGIDAIGYESTLPGKYRYTNRNRARHGVISDNTVRNIISRGNPSYYEDGSWCNCADGIYVDGGTHIRVERNRLAGNDIGVEVAAENARGSADHVVVADNSIRTSAFTGIATGGYCNGAQDCGGVQTGISHHNVFVNNTLYANNTLDDGSPQILIQYYAYRDTVENNVVYATNSDDVLLGTVPGAGSDGLSTRNRIDHNLYYARAGSARSASFGSLGTTYTGFGAYRQATGLDRHSRFVDPRLVAPRAGDLHLRPGSPAIDAGVTVPARLVGRHDIDGQRRVRGAAIDIGSDERR